MQGSDQVRLQNLIGPAFYPVHRAIRNGTHSSFWLRGGRGSLKSSFAALQIVKGMALDPLANAIAFRKTAASLKDSVIPTFEWAIDKLGWSLFFKLHKSDEEITYLPTGQKIIMRGLDDAQKMKSIKTKKGYLKYLWFEEGAEYTDLDEMESVRISVLRGGTVFTEFVTYNPPAEPYAWINEEARRPEPGRFVHESNYKQSPPAWLGPKFLADAANMERDRPEKHAHVYMGVEVGRTDAIIFSGCYRVESFTRLPEWDGPYFGADWGFSQDPTVLVKMWIHGKTIYIEHEAFQVNCMPDKIPALFDQIPDSRRYTIRADCARPETIAHVKARGFDIEAAPKWAGSIEDGIEIMKSYEIVIHPRCEEILKEMRTYRYKIDRLSRDVLADIVDKNNHGIDACRYGLNPIIQKQEGWFM